jgi:hypothetical protein
MGRVGVDVCGSMLNRIIVVCVIVNLVVERQGEARRRIIVLGGGTVIISLPPRLKTATEKSLVTDLNADNSDLNDAHNPPSTKAPCQLADKKIHPFFNKFTNATKLAPQPACSTTSSGSTVIFHQYQCQLQ